MASSHTATIMAATMNFLSLSLFLSLSFFSRFPSSPFLSIISLCIQMSILFFSLALKNRTESFLFLLPLPHTAIRVWIRFLAHEIYSFRRLLAVSSSLPHSPFPPYRFFFRRSPLGLSLSFQQWHLHKSRYNVEMDQREWPRPTRGRRGNTGHSCVCIIAYSVHT